MEASTTTDEWKELVSKAQHASVYFLQGKQHDLILALLTQEPSPDEATRSRLIHQLQLVLLSMVDLLQMLVPYQIQPLLMLLSLQDAFILSLKEQAHPVQRQQIYVLLFYQMEMFEHLPPSASHILERQRLLMLCYNDQPLQNCANVLYLKSLEREQEHSTPPPSQCVPDAMPTTAAASLLEQPDQQGGLIDLTTTTSEASEIDETPTSPTSAPDLNEEPTPSTTISIDETPSAIIAAEVTTPVLNSTKQSAPTLVHDSGQKQEQEEDAADRQQQQDAADRQPQQTDGKDLPIPTSSRTLGHGSDQKQGDEHQQQQQVEADQQQQKDEADQQQQHHEADPQDNKTGSNPMQAYGLRPRKPTCYLEGSNPMQAYGLRPRKPTCYLEENIDNKPDDSEALVDDSMAPAVQKSKPPGASKGERTKRKRQQQLDRASQIRRTRLQQMLRKDGVVNSGKWSLRERLDFLRGLRKFGPGKWSQVQSIVKTRSNVQIKSYGQKKLRRMYRGENIYAELEEFEDDSDSDDWESDVPAEAKEVVPTGETNNSEEPVEELEDDSDSDVSAEVDEVVNSGETINSEEQVEDLEEQVEELEDDSDSDNPADEEEPVSTAESNSEKRGQLEDDSDCDSDNPAEGEESVATGETINSEELDEVEDDSHSVLPADIEELVATGESNNSGELGEELENHSDPDDPVDTEECETTTNSEELEEVEDDSHSVIPADLEQLVATGESIYAELEEVEVEGNADSDVAADAQERVAMGETTNSEEVQEVGDDVPVDVEEFVATLMEDAAMEDPTIMLEAEIAAMMEEAGIETAETMADDYDDVLDNVTVMETMMP